MSGAWRKVRRLATMSPRELLWRSRAASRIAIDRGRTWLTPARWNPGALAGALAPRPELAPMRAALDSGRWADAHAAFCRFLVDSPQRFVIGPGSRERLSADIQHAFGDSARDAQAHSTRLVAGEYDLLGYQGLCFPPAGGRIDWHRDPVNDRRAPLTFWTDVPFLDPSCGDHKIIWELNRHQHWLALGRALLVDGRRALIEPTRSTSSPTGWRRTPLMGINWASMLELAFRSISGLAVNFFVDPARDDARPWTIDLLMGLDRQLEQIERNLSHYFSPEHAPARRGAGAYASRRGLPVFRASAAGARPLHLCAEIGQIAADGGHWANDLRTITATRSTSICWRWQWRASATTPRRSCLRRRGGSPGVGRASDRRRWWPPSAFRRRRRRIHDADRSNVPRRCERQSSSAASVLSTGRSSASERHLKKCIGCWLTRSCARVRLRLLRTSWHPAGSGALERTDTTCRDRGPAIISSSTVVRMSTQNGGHAHADALSLTLTLDGLLLHRSRHRFVHREPTAALIVSDRAPRTIR